MVRSEVVAALLLGANPDHDPGDRPALRLTGAHLTGRLDIGFTEVAVPVRLTDCRFDEAPLVQGARTRELALTGCVLPGLLADTAQIDGRLVVSHCTLTGPLVLTRIQVNGDLDLRDTVVRHPAGEAIPAVHARVGGDALCANLAVEGTFRLSGASIEGEFDLEGATLRAPGGHALDAYHIRVAEDFTCHPGFSAEGRIILSGATVAAAVGFCGARLSNPGDIALEAVDVTVGRNFDLGLGLTVDGAVKLDGTRVGTELSFRDAELTHKDGTALSLRAAQARETDLRTRRPVDAVVDARNARLGTLYDAQETWPTDLRLADATYETLAFPLPAAQRVRWIRRTTGDYFPSRTSNWRRPTGGWATRTRPARYCWPSSATAVPPSPRTPACGATSRTSPSATATAPSAPACGSWPFWPAEPSTSPSTPRPPRSGQGPALQRRLLHPRPPRPDHHLRPGARLRPRGPGQWLSYALITAGWILATTVTAGVSRTLNRQ